MMETIEIALAADGGYFCGLFVTACSIAEHANKDVELSYNILDGGISGSDWMLLGRKIHELHPRSRLRRIAVDEALFAAYPKWNGNRMAYARLILPTAMKDRDWVVYCDCDFLWMRDISELWNERDDENWLIGTPDQTSWSMVLERDWFAQNGFPFDSGKYFCSGLCVFNLKKFREQNLIARCQEIMSLPDIHFPDQAALNVVTWGHVKLLPKAKWQCFTHELTQEALDAGTVIHYAGEIPWKFVKGIQVLSDSMLIWHRFNAKYRGVSLWRSLRMHFGVLRLLGHRGWHWLFRTPLLKEMLRFVLVKIGHRGVYDVFAMRARKFHVGYAV